MLSIGNNVINHKINHINVKFKKPTKTCQRICASIDELKQLFHFTFSYKFTPLFPSSLNIVHSLGAKIKNNYSQK